MSLSKTLARKIVFPLVLNLGLEKALSALSKRKAVVIMYHGVADIIDPKLNGRHLLTEQFEKHLKYLKRNFNIVPLTEIFNKQRANQQFSRKTIAITFDDGFLNNYSIAYPLLKKYNIPATFFIITAGLMSDTYVNWPDFFEIINRYSDVSKITIAGQIFERNGKEYYSEKLKISAIYYFKNLNSDREALLNNLKEQCNFNFLVSEIPLEYWKLVNSQQVKELSDSGLIEIGSHSHLHYNLGDVSAILAKQELELSKKMLENIIQKPVLSIAYPDGSYSDIVKNISIECGYKNLVAVKSKVNSDKSDLNIVTRFGISNTTTFESNMVQIHNAFRSK